jgi:hypothetical protein
MQASQKDQKVKGEIPQAVHCHFLLLSHFEATPPVASMANPLPAARTKVQRLLPLRQLLAALPSRLLKNCGGWAVFPCWLV